MIRFSLPDHVFEGMFCFMKLKRITEDYVKTIYALSRKGEVRAYQLANCFSVSRPTVSVTIKALAQEGFVYVDRKKTVHLTPRGLEIAQAMEERHEVLFDLLVGLGVDPDVASGDACKMEHALSAESFLALKSLTRFSG